MDACGPPTPPVPRPRTRQGGGLGSGCSRPLPAASGAGPWAEDTLRPVTFARNKRIRSPAGSPRPRASLSLLLKTDAVKPPGAPGLVTAALSSDSSPFSQGKLDSGPLLGCGAAWGKWRGAEAQASQRGTAGAARNPGPTSEPPAELQAGGWLCSGEDEPT